MRREFSLFRFSFFWLSALFFILSGAPRPSAFAGQPQASEALPYLLCWQMPSDNVSAFAPAFSNKRLFVPLTNGNLLAIGSIDGEIIWKTDLGGEILSAPQINSQTIYVATQTTSSAENKDKASNITLRALSQSTGVTLWQINFSSAQNASFVLSENLLLAAIIMPNGARQLTAFSKETGEQKWTRELPANLTSALSAAASTLYLGFSDGSLHVIDLENGSTKKQFKLKHAVQGEILAAGDNLIFSDAGGKVSALRISDSKIAWTLRTGGRVQNSIITKLGLLVSSLDNFVYLASFSNGKRIWQRRLTGRPLAASQLTPETILFLTNGDTDATILNLKNGKILYQIPLGRDNYAVSPPAVFDGGFLIPTFAGILTFSRYNDQCPVKTAVQK